METLYHSTYNESILELYPGENVRVIPINAIVVKNRVQTETKLTRELHLVDREGYGHMSRPVFTSQDELYQVQVESFSF